MVTLQIWDTAGQERFQSLGSSFYRGSDCCILVYDITNRKSFESLDKWRNEFLLSTGIDPQDVNFVVVGNKLDLEDRRSVSLKDGLTWAENNSAFCFETSAKDATNVTLAFQKAANLATNKIRETPPITIPIAEPTAQQGCCT
eukprot:CAMPEP_0174252182 /NCGR_PEP_ID=MMETSP0439-20130205/1764_1 /TAXON_ID=0 /ORGANISM="Stereomyxa ramosa, Strain Chinc5" /LENGTH=142 /DNA_ID=CAMNT_0015332683 /DNA_START=204 /DNA_END=632 /DNA_ORIENTATION=+